MTDNLANKTIKNSIFSFIGYVFPIAFSIILTPVLVLNLGKASYGLFIFINTVIIVLGLLDLGLSSALIKFLAQYHAAGATEKIKRLLATNNSLFWLIGSAGLLVFIIIGIICRWLFPTLNLSEFYSLAIFGIAGLLIFINAANSVYTITPRALQRYDIASKIDLAQLIVCNSILLVLAWMHFDLFYIFLTQTIVALIFSFVYRHYAVKLLPEAKLRFGWDKSEIKQCYSFGLKTFVSSLAGSSLNYFDRLIIPIFLGPAALTYYSLPGNVTTHIHGVSNSLTTVLFPAVSSLNATTDIDKIKDVYVKAVRVIAVLGAAITLSIMLFSYKILQFWINTDMAQTSWYIMCILALTHFVVALGRPLTSFLLGLGHTKLLAIYSVLMAALNIVLLLAFIGLWGITGAAWAYLLSVLPLFIVFYIFEKKYLRLTSRFKDIAILKLKIVSTGAIFAPLVYFFIIPLISNIFFLIILGPLSVLLYLALYRLFGFFEADDLRTLRRFYEPIMDQIIKPLKFKAK